MGSRYCNHCLVKQLKKHTKNRIGKVKLKRVDGWWNVYSIVRGKETFEFGCSVISRKCAC